MFFARTVFLPNQMYATKTNANHKPYVKHPADPAVKTWQTRRSAQSWCDKRRSVTPDVALFEVVEAPLFWRKRDPRTPAEWDELARFVGVTSGAVMRRQVRLADEILNELDSEDKAREVQKDQS